MLHILYDGQVLDKVFNNYEEIENYLKNIIDDKAITDKYTVLNFLDDICIEGLSLSAQVDLFKDLYNYAMEDCISIIDEQGEYI